MTRRLLSPEPGISGALEGLSRRLEIELGSNHGENVIGLAGLTVRLPPEPLLDFAGMARTTMLHSWRRILAVSIPATATS